MPQMDFHVAQTVKVFRDCGFTINAIRYPLSEAALAWLCKFNGAPAGWKPPYGWRYAPNAACRDNCERNAAATGAKPAGEPLTHDSLTAPSHEAPARISAALGSRPQQTSNSTPST